MHRHYSQGILCTERETEIERQRERETERERSLRTTSVVFADNDLCDHILIQVYFVNTGVVTFTANVVVSIGYVSVSLRCRIQAETFTG